MSFAKIEKATKGMRHTDIYKNTFQAMELLLKSCYGIQKIYDFRSSMPANQYLKDFCTIRLQSARRSGHSSAMFNLIGKYFDTVMIIYMNLRQVKIMKQYLRHRDIKCQKEKIIMETPITIKNNIRGIKLDAVFVDCPVTKKTEELIYRDCTAYINPNKHFFIFFIG